MAFPDSFPLPLSRHLFQTGLQEYIQCPHRAVVDKFLLVDQHLHVPVKGSIEEPCFWVSRYFSSSVLHVLFVFLEGFRVGRQVYVQPLFCGGCCFQDLSNITRSILLQLLSRFSLYAYSGSMWCICNIATHEYVKRT